MPGEIYVLCAVVVLLAVLLLNLNLRSAWRWPVKAGAVVVTFGVLALGYFALAGVTGWPASRPLPAHFVLVAADIREPDKRTGDAGAIYIWAKPLERSRDEPRAYRVSYSLELHRRLAEALQRVRDGARLHGEVEGQRQASSARGRAPPEPSGIRFYEPRRPALAEKRRS